MDFVITLLILTLKKPHILRTAKYSIPGGTELSEPEPKHTGVESTQPVDAEPWSGELWLDPLTVSRILESWDLFEELDCELPKETEKPV